MFESLKKNFIGLAAALSLGTCTGCAGTQLIASQQPTTELFAAAETVDQKAWATIGLYYDTLETATEMCAKPTTPMETCAALEVAFDQTAERVATASDAFASVIAYRTIYGNIEDAEGFPDKAVEAKALLDQALVDWATLRPKVENAIKLGRKLDPNLELAGGPEQ